MVVVCTTVDCADLGAVGCVDDCDIDSEAGDALSNTSRPPFLTGTLGNNDNPAKLYTASVLCMTSKCLGVQPTESASDDADAGTCTPPAS